MPRITDQDLAIEIREAALPLAGIAANYDPLIGMVGEAQFVLLGEASHGTHQFYHERAQITQRLIEEKGFAAVAAEADWPDASRVNRFVHGIGGDTFAHEALLDFKRFPTWMWRNTAAAEFVDWLREHNDSLPSDGAKAGFYGLDLYSMRTSMNAVLRFLEKADPNAAKLARERYACFDHFGEDEQVYGFLTASGATRSCEEQAVQQLVELQKNAAQYVGRKPLVDEDEVFYAEQNARLVKNAEQYYRTMFTRGESSWNLRDRHMMETLQALARHLKQKGVPPKIVVWAHNSHLGDARATEMGWRRGELNIGQLVRQAYGQGALLVGATTDHGTVTAASDWGEPAQRKRVSPAFEHSYESLFHDAKLRPGFLLDLRTSNEATRGLRESRLERAIGVIYRPSTERVSHYFSAELPEQFDVVMHFDETRAVEPLERNAEWEKAEAKGELPETYPFGV
jgi:erythromycin esterase-like protein